MADPVPTEESLKRQARRRLIGAVALVLLAVIFLPVVFDDEPPPATGDDIELRIPDKDKAPAFQPAIDLPQLDKMASQVGAASSPESVPVSAVPAAQALTSPQERPREEAKPQKDSRPKGGASRAANSSASKTVPSARRGWGVQIGAFADADKARSLQMRLVKQGYAAYTEQVDSMTRVRVGGYPTREAAEKARHKLAAQGMPGNVVNLE